MEILVLAIVSLLTTAVSLVLGLRTIERTTLGVAKYLENTVGGKPLELHRREIDLRERQADVEKRKAELEIEIRKSGFEGERKLQELRLRSLETSMASQDPEA